jgi:hypothetical protein
MLKHFLMFFLAVPLCGHCQSYADSPFYVRASAIPSAAHVEGWSHGSIKANGVVIDLSESVPYSSPDFDEIRGWSLGSRVDGSKPAQLFHFFIQYDQLNVIFGYDLLAQPVEGTDKIKCTFSAFTDYPVADPPQQGRYPCCSSGGLDSSGDPFWRCNLNRDASSRAGQNCGGPLPSPDSDRSNADPTQ